MRYKEVRPYFYEVLETQCPYCGADYMDKDIGWREKSFSDKGRSFLVFRCQKVSCSKLFKLKE